MGQGYRMHTRRSTASLDTLFCPSHNRDSPSTSHYHTCINVNLCSLFMSPTSLHPSPTHVAKELLQDMPLVGYPRRALGAIETTKRARICLERIKFTQSGYCSLETFFPLLQRPNTPFCTLMCRTLRARFSPPCLFGVASDITRITRNCGSCIRL